MQSVATSLAKKQKWSGHYKSVETSFKIKVPLLMVMFKQITEFNNLEHCTREQRNTQGISV